MLNLRKIVKKATRLVETSEKSPKAFRKAAKALRKADPSGAATTEALLTTGAFVTELVLKKNMKSSKKHKRVKSAP